MAAFRVGFLDVLAIFAAVLIAGICYRMLAYYAIASENERLHDIGELMLFAY